MRRERLLWIEPRIDQPHDPSLATFQADHLASAHETIVHVRPLPKTGLNGGHRMRREPFHAQAQIPREFFPRHIAVETRNTIDACGLFHAITSVELHATCIALGHSY